MERNIFKILHREHEDILSLIAHIEECEQGEKQKLFNQLDAELTAHTKGEEISLYRVMEPIPRVRELVHTAVAQHIEVADALKKMQNMPMTGREWLQSLGNLKSMVLNHVTMEENELFALGRDKLDSLILEQMTNEFQAEKQRILQSRGAGIR